MRQIVYRSVPRIDLSEPDLLALLIQCRTNNAIDSVSGLLFAGAGSFVQAIEGPDESVDPLMERIVQDNRHSDVRVLSTRAIAEREFGVWSMAFLTAHDHPRAVRERLDRALTLAAAKVRAAFADCLALPTTD